MVSSPLVVNYWDGSTLVFCDDFGGAGAGAPPAIGSGVLLPDGERWRVVDVWVSYDKHGHFDRGVHVFIKLAEPDEDRLKLLAPHYFRD